MAESLEQKCERLAEEAADRVIMEVYPAYEFPRDREEVETARNYARRACLLAAAAALGRCGRGHNCMFFAKVLCPACSEAARLREKAEKL